VERLVVDRIGTLARLTRRLGSSPWPPPTKGRQGRTLALWPPAVRPEATKGESLGSSGTLSGEGDAGPRRGRAAKLGAAAAASSAGHVAVLEKVVEQYRVLLETSALITASTDLSETLGTITRLVAEHFGVAWCDLYDYDKRAQAFEVVAYYQLPEIDVDSSEWVGTRYDSTEYASMFASSLDRRPVIWYRDDNELDESAKRNMGEWGELSSLTVPLVYRGDVIGQIDVGESRYQRHFTDDDVRVMQAIADHAAIAIANARAYARLEELAITDGLTGLSNRRCLNDRLRRAVAEALRHGQKLSLLMLDVDDFKTFNDTYGHLQGDKLLVELAQILREGTRQDVDVTARYGGEEFAVILPQTPPSGTGSEAAREVAERLRSAVAEHPFEGWPGRRSDKVTVSIGVAGLRAAPVACGDGAAADPGDGAARLVALAADHLLTDADKALYLAKQSGKDRVCTHDA
jgi:diguanylate cyclase (GGDEF)-like protein